MKISASLYSNKEKPREELVAELDKCNIDYFHIDCNDDPSVFGDIQEIRKISQTPIDLHIITEDPNPYLELLQKSPVERVCFQFENLPSKLDIPTIDGTSFGLALVSDTGVEAFEEYKNDCDFVLIMTTTPGQSGGKFRPDNFQKIRKFRNRFPGKEIEVDGGVNDEVGFILRMLGVQSVVSGSYLVNHESIPEALLHLRSSVIHSEFRVKDFMIVKENAPVVSIDSTIQRIIQTIDNYKMGFAIVEDDEGKLAGISSNADMRKGLLRKFEDLNELTTSDIVNENPTSISEDATITEMLDFIHAKKFLISYLPVVAANGLLSGAVSFINLIRSES
ncbi:MAG: CBS domain-containing protein [Cytophagales bacterium]|nr:CBS domain-containing protein [Cytophagales bacterium]